ncbi:small ribosomal subunit protein mS35-like isoform X2 [Sycon ciliatum]|uniref:small ribosomal subunit protein mS35-like isoform X2 n=1 Tax=Sycon ciliatum TaxID=27933 RepID=UPI0031F651A9
MALLQGRAAVVGSCLLGSCRTAGVRELSCSSARCMIGETKLPVQDQQLRRRPRRNFIKLSSLGLSKAKLVDGKSHLNEDWTDVWPVARMFDHNVVHLPLRMGHPPIRGDPYPDSIANQELMKIPNLLHLTPKHIEKHIEALRPLCTKWPANMTNFTHPIRVTTSNYLRPGRTTLHPDSLVVTMTVHIDAIPLFKEKLQKLVAIVGDRFDPKTGLLTLKSDTLTTRRLNRDHLNYQLLAIYFELQKEEDWEKTDQIPVYNL